MSNWQYAGKLPTSPWRGQMSLPRRLSFLKDQAGLVIRQEPITAPLRARSHSIPGSSIATLASGNHGSSIAPPYELELHFNPSGKDNFGVRVVSDPDHWTEIGYDMARKVFYIDRTKSGVAISADFPARTEAPIVASRLYDLRLIVDRSSVEAYAQNGTIAMTDLIYPPSAGPSSTGTAIQLFPQATLAATPKSHLWELKSIWREHPPAT